MEAGDGTTTVCVLAGALLGAVSQLMARGIHPMTIAESFSQAGQQAVEVLNGLAIPLDLTDREGLLKSAITALNSKVVISMHTHLNTCAGCFTIFQLIGPHCSRCCVKCDRSQNRFKC